MFEWYPCCTQTYFPLSGMPFAAPVQTCTDWHAVDSQANFPIVYPTERVNGSLSQSSLEDTWKADAHPWASSKLSA